MRRVGSGFLVLQGEAMCDDQKAWTNISGRDTRLVFGLGGMISFIIIITTVTIITVNISILIDHTIKIR